MQQIRNRRWITTLLVMTGMLTASAEAPEPLLKTPLAGAVANGESQYSALTFKLPPIAPPPGFFPALRFNARVEFPTYGGWCANAMQLKLNGAILTAQTAAGQARLLNRQTALTSSNPRYKATPWYSPNHGLLAFYAPTTTEEPDKIVTSDREAGFEYVLDIRDLAKKSGDNELVVRFNMLKKMLKGKSIELKLKEINIVYLPQPTAAPTAGNDFRLENAGSKGVATQKISLPAVRPPRGTVPVLVFNARIETPSYGGWNPYISLRLNGKKLDELTAAGSRRLLRRGGAMQTSLPNNATLPWWKTGRLMTFFAPSGTEELDPRITRCRTEGFNYCLDISDLANHVEIGADERIEKADPNELELSFTLRKRDVGGKNLNLRVKDLKIIYLPTDEVRQSGAILRTLRHRAPAAAATLPVSHGTLRVTADGGAELQINGESFFLDSEFSYIAAPAMKFNPLGPGPGAPAWSRTVRQTGPTVVIQAQYPGFYRVTREFTPEGATIAVTDKITNTGNDDLGLAIWNSLTVNDLKLDRYRLAGQSAATSVEFFGSSNPTLFAPGKSAAIGVVAEDTVSRAQMFMNAVANTLRFGTAGAGLPKGQTLTRQWRIFPLPEGDYYTFINTVRERWGVNKVTIPGPVAFSRHGAQPQRKAIVMIYPWFEYADGASLTREQYQAKILPQLAAARAAHPDAYRMGMLETNLVPFRCDTVPWGGEIVQRPVGGARNGAGIQYGQFLSSALTKKLDAATTLSDSIIRNASGNAMIDNMYPEKPFINLMVQPESGNTRYRQMLEQMDFLFSLGINSIYMDQFQPYIIGGFSDNRWDGHTVTLNPDGTIRSKRYSYAIAGAPARAALLKHAQSRGGIVLTNGQPMSMEEQQAGGLAFQEMENDNVDPAPFMREKPPEFRWQTVSHLGTPIALGIRPRKYLNLKQRPNRAAEYLTKGVITALRNGLVYYGYLYDINLDGQADSGSFELFYRMFPFTPVELNEGFVIGRERIISARSRSFTVKSAPKPAVYHYNSRGIPYTDVKFAVTGAPGAWQVDVKLDDWNEIAIIEMNPKL